MTGCGHVPEGDSAVYPAAKTKPLSELTAAEREQWDAWVAARPPAVQAAIRHHPLGRYRNVQTGQLVWIVAYEERADGTCTTVRVNIFRDENPDSLAFHVLFAGDEVYQVFGMPLADLVAEGV